MSEKGNTKRTIAYPTNAFIVYMRVREKKNSFLYPFEYIETSYDQLHTEATLFSNTFAEQGYTIEPVSILLPVIYYQPVPLINEYWSQSEHLHFYGSTERYHMFLSLLETPVFFRILVTPRGKTDETELLSAAIPLTNTSLPKSIDFFMYGSDYPVDEKAANAALYTPGKPYAFNWKNKTSASFPAVHLNTQTPN